MPEVGGGSSCRRGPVGAPRAAGGAMSPGTLGDRPCAPLRARGLSVPGRGPPPPRGAQPCDLLRTGSPCRGFSDVQALSQMPSGPPAPLGRRLARSLSESPCRRGTISARFTSLPPRVRGPSVPGLRLPRLPGARFLPVMTAARPTRGGWRLLWVRWGWLGDCLHRWLLRPGRRQGAVGGLPRVRGVSPPGALQR